MKKYRLLKLLSAVALLGGGAFALASKKAEGQVDKVEATVSTEVTLYINEFNSDGYWNNFSYYLFGGSAGEKTAWPGDYFTNDMKTSTPNEYDQYQYVLTVDTAVYPKLILVGNPQNWGGYQAQTDDLVIADIADNGVFSSNQIPDTNKFNIGTYHYSTKRVYCLDLKGDAYSTHFCHTWATDHSGTSFPGVEMTKVVGSNNVYYADINSALDNVMFNNGSGKQTDTIPSVAAEDAYVIYPDNGYNKLTLQAASFVDSYMKFETKWLDDEGEGVCKTGGWYTAAKSAYLAKTDAQKLEILAHEPTKYRLQAWARANKEDLDFETGAISASYFGISSVDGRESSDLVVIVAIVSVISVSTLAALIVIKKRRAINK